MVMDEVPYPEIAEISGISEGNLRVKQPEKPINHQFGADADPADYQPIKVIPKLKSSPALSMANTIKGNIKTRQVAFLAAEGVDSKSLSSMKSALEAEGAVVRVIAPHSGFIKDSDGKDVKVDHSFLTFASVLVDAIYVPAGDKSIEKLKKTPKAVHFIDEAYLHCKAIATDGNANELLKISYVAHYLNKNLDKVADAGLIIGNSSEGNFAKNFIEAIGNHRFFEREKSKIPA